MLQIEQTLTSLQVAEMIEKPHKNLLRSIGTYQQHFSQLNFESADYFQETTYRDEQGKQRKCYNITKLGCELIAHKLTGVKGTAFTVRYINAFHDMEQKLKEQQPPQLPAKEAYLLKNSKEQSWFEQNNWRMKMICDCFGWTRKYLYHKLLSELSDIYNFKAIEDLYMNHYGRRAQYRTELIDFFTPMRETSERYLDYLMYEIDE